MLFRVDGKEYGGESALEIVQSIKREAPDGASGSLTLREFLRRSLEQLSDRIHFRELDVSDRLDDETLALGYLYLLDKFGTGKLSGIGSRKRRAHAL
ncbi:MAG TPA: hypothetical protein VER08_07890 [Pyrinomonadaceae bacterium]|nr:hypothetical protein [Pyrinomonadaceae bacterium]